jgi:hypothetical protein
MLLQSAFAIKVLVLFCGLHVMKDASGALKSVKW